MERLPMPRRIILMQSVETNAGKNGIIGSHLQSPISRRGYRQFAALQRKVVSHLAGIGWVISAPDSGSTQTAALLQQRMLALHVAKFRIEELLADRNFGALRGQEIAFVEHSYPGLLKDLELEWSVAPPGGETLQEVRVRIGQVIERLLIEYLEDLVLVVPPAVRVGAMAYLEKTPHSTAALSMLQPPNCWGGVYQDAPLGWVRIQTF